MNDMYRFKASISQDTTFPCAKEDGEKDLEGKLRLNFQHKITPKQHPGPSTDNSKKKDFQDIANLTEFSHRFIITNEGPSRTNEAQTISIYIPDIVDQRKQIVLNPESIVRSRDCSSRQYNGDDVIEVCTEGCTLYECTIDKGFNKRERITAELKMELNPALARKKSDSFKVMTALKINGLDAFAETTFTERETDVGLLRTIRKMWPIPVGVLAGLIIVSTIIYMAYKKGWLQSLRFTKAKMEMDNYKAGGAENIYQN